MQGINSDPINAQELHKIIFEELNETNIEIMTKKLWNYSNKKPISFYLYVCKIVYFAYAYRQKEINVCIEFLKKIYMLENDSSKSKKMQDKFITDYFSDLMLLINTQESKYFLEAMINNNMKTEDIFIHQLVIPRFFSHYNQGERHYFSSSMHDKYFKKNLDKLKKNNWELHKQLIKEGVNPNELAKIIRNDEIEKLQEISSQNDFDFNQIIRRSIYERHSFINQKDVTLIDYAAFFGSVQCFKYLLMNNANVKNTGKYAVAGGNEEIIHLCEQNHSSFKDAYETAIKYHQNEIFKYLYENKIGKLENFEKLGKKCVQNSNFEIFSFLVQQGMKVHEYHDYNLLTIFSDNNTKWCSYLMGEKLDSEFYFTDDVKTSLLKDLKLFDFLLNINMIDLNYIHIENYHFEDVSTSYLGLAIQSENIELMKYLLQKDKINIHLGAMRTLDTTENCDPYVKIKKSLTLAIKTKNLDVVKLLVENDYFKNDNGVAVAKKSRCYKMSYAEYCQKVSADEILDYLNQVEGAKMEIEEEEEEEWNETEEEEWNETEEEEEWNETEEEEECNEIEEEDY